MPLSREKGDLHGMKTLTEVFDVRLSILSIPQPHGSDVNPQTKRQVSLKWLPSIKKLTTHENWINTVSNQV